MGIYTTNSTQKMIQQLVGRLRALNWQLGRVLRERAPQVQEIANLHQAISDTQYALAVARNNG